jgi:hypothetical protein
MTNQNGDETDISTDAKLTRQPMIGREREKGSGSLSLIQPMKWWRAGPTINLHGTRAGPKTEFEDHHI